jgi:hypothetical protein
MIDANAEAYPESRKPSLVLDLALTFLQGELNAHFARRTGSDAMVVDLTKLVDENGKLAVTQNHLALTLIQIEEDRVMRGQVPEYTSRDGKHLRSEPDLRLSLGVMIAANFKAYDVGLKYLSEVLACFQSQPAFRPETHPALHAGFGQLSVELQSPSFEQLNQIWAYLGAKFLPSVIYRIRLVVLRDQVSQVVPTVLEPRMVNA